MCCIISCCYFVQAGFIVDKIELVPRPTILPAGTGMRGWMSTFTQAFLNALPEDPSCRRESSLSFLAEYRSVFLPLQSSLSRIPTLHPSFPLRLPRPSSPPLPPIPHPLYSPRLPRPRSRPLFPPPCRPPSPPTPPPVTLPYPLSPPPPSLLSTHVIYFAVALCSARSSALCDAFV